MTVAQIWLLLGILLAVSEFAVPGLVIVFFGIGALVTAGVTWFTEPSLTVQIGIFAAASVASLLIGRRCCRGVLRGQTFRRAASDEDIETASDALIGATGRVTGAIRPPESGRVAVRGSDWSATADEPLEPGATVRVVSRDGIVIHVKQEV